jgi:hypothetical protein
MWTDGHDKGNNMFFMTMQTWLQIYDNTIFFVRIERQFSKAANISRYVLHHVSQNTFRKYKARLNYYMN